MAAHEAPSRFDPIPARAGIGLRFPHHEFVVTERPCVSWFEVHSENYMGGGAPLRALMSVRRDRAISLHGVGLSLGSADGLDQTHLGRIADLAARIEPGLISEHMSWSAYGGTYFADLLPLPLTEEALDMVCRNVDRFQGAVRRRALIENPSSYMQYRHSTIPEAEFLAAVARRTGCGILCDVNNIFVSCANHGWDAQRYLAALPGEAIGEIHLAGHSIRTLANGVTIRIDDHGSPVCGEVWRLFAAAIDRFGRKPALIEWDNALPSFDVLQREAATAQGILDSHSGSEARADAA